MAAKNQSKPDQTPANPNPETPKPELKVGDIVHLKPMVGVIYEANGGYSVRIQTADGTKHRNVPKDAIELAPQAEAKAFLKVAPAELQPEAIIKREAEEESNHHGFGSSVSSAGSQGGGEEEEEE